MKSITTNIILGVLLALLLLPLLLSAQVEGVPADLADKPFSEWQLNITTATIALMLLGRIYSGLRKGGGLVGLGRGILFGENTPKPPAT